MTSRVRSSKKIVKVHNINHQKVKKLLLCDNQIFSRKSAMVIIYTVICFHVKLHAQMECVNELCHVLLYVTYFWQSTKKIWEGTVSNYVKKEQFDMNLKLVVKRWTLNDNQGESIKNLFYGFIKYFICNSMLVFY